MAALSCSLTAYAALSQVGAGAEAADEDGELTIVVSPDAGDIEKGLTGTHVLQMQPAARSKIGQGKMQIGCVPCFSIFLSFAQMDGRLFAMNGHTDNRRERYRAVVGGRTLPVEAMSGLRGRDWLDAFSGVDQVPGCARNLAKGKDLDAVVRRAVCISR